MEGVKLIFISILLSFFLSFSLSAQEGEFVDSDESSVHDLKVKNLDNEFEQTQGKFYKKLDKRKAFKKVSDLRANELKKKGISFHNKGDKESLENLLNQVEKENKDILKKFGKIDEKKLQKLLKNKNVSEVAKLLMAKDKNGLSALPGIGDALEQGKLKKIIKRMIALNRVLSKNELKEHLRSQARGTELETFYDQNPSVLEFLAKILRDENALPTLTEILDDRKKITIFVLINIVIFVFGFILARFKKNFKFLTLKRFSYFVFRFFLIFSLRIAAFVYMYHSELAPTMKIAVNSFPWLSIFS